MNGDREGRRALTPEQRKARDAQRRADAERALRECERDQSAFHANRERLKAERLARANKTKVGYQSSVSSELGHRVAGDGWALRLFQELTSGRRSNIPLGLPLL